MKNHESMKKESSKRLEKIVIGKVVNAVGLKGELKVCHYSDSKERFAQLSHIGLGDEPYPITKVRYRGNLVLLQLAGIEDRTQAEGQKNKELWITKDQLGKLPEGSYYIRDLLGMSVQEPDGKPLGTLTDVIQRSAQDLYQVEMQDKRKLLIPAVPSFILEIDEEKRMICVQLPEGLLDLAY